MSKETPIFAFVLMPFAKKYDDVYKLGIKPSAEAQGIIAERLDEQKYSEGMLDRIHRQIEAADLIIADMSGLNVNVFYELGYATAKEKLCITIAQVETKTPFDLSHKRHIIYDDIAGLISELEKEIKWAKDEIKTKRASDLEVKLSIPYSMLQLSSYKAEAEMQFQIDIHRKTLAGPVPQIDYAYFYCGKNWSFVQNNEECPKTDSDIEGFSGKHLIKPPVSKINDWMQVKFKGIKEIANKFDGDDLKDEYNVSGIAILRIFTNTGSYDFKLNINENVSEIPF